MAFRTLSPDAVKRLLTFRQEGTPLPLKITDHKAKLEEATQKAEEESIQTGVIDHDVVQRLLRMKLELDALYGDWAEGIERVRWCDIPLKADITPVQIVRECIYSTEMPDGDAGIDVLARYLETQGYFGILKNLARAYLEEIRRFLEEGFPLDEEALAVLRDPKGFFAVAEENDARRRMSRYFMTRADRQPPPQAKQALIAYIEFSLGNFAAALNHASNAYCEKHVAYFSQKLQISGHPEVENIMIESEVEKAKLLIKLLAEARNAA